MNEEGLMQGKRSNIDLWCGRGGEGLGKVGGGGGGGGGEGGEGGGGGGSGDCRAGRRFSQLGLPAILASRLFRRLRPASNSRPREGNRPLHICTPLCLDFTAMSNDYDKLGGSSGKVRHK